MRLVTVQIENYRCISNSGIVPIDPSVTCLVGKNESGKTAFLRALHLLNPLNPIKGKTSFDPVVDLPAKDYAKHRTTAMADKGPNVVSAGLELTDGELARLQSDFGEGFVADRVVSVSRGYEAATKRYGLAFQERIAVQHMLKAVELSEALRAEADKLDSVAALKAFLSGHAEPHSSATGLLGTIASWREERLDLYIIDSYLSKWLPKFFYFDEYSTMPGRIAVAELKRKVDAKEVLTEGEQAFLAFLKVGGADIEALQSGTRTEALIRELENAGIGITAEAMRYWTQNEGLRVQVRETQADPRDDDANLRTGQILNLRIENTNQFGVTSPFDDRSRGFVWFFSFIAYFTGIEADHTQGSLVLLLDEPGLSLHGTAQADFMRFINERLAISHQVIYTTHSPFMVEPNRFDRVRTVEDTQPLGTVVSSDIFRSQPGTSLPLLTKMGVDLFQSLMVGPNTLLVEGGSDFLYLQLLSRELERRGKNGLDERWVVVPVTGVGKFEPFFRLYEANKINVAVLMDASTFDKKLVDELRRRGSGQQVVTIGEILGVEDSDIEDLLGPDFYLSLVEGAYGLSAIDPASVISKHPRIAKRLEQHFADAGLNAGRFSHYRPATYLRENKALLEGLDSTVIDAAGRLVDRLNALVPPES